MQRLLALCAAATALYVTPPRRLRRTTVKGDNDDVTEADVRKWMESADVDELLKGGIDLEEIEERELPEMKIDKKEYDASPYVGDFDGTDDELEAPWRTEAAQICREAIAAIGLECADVFWEPGVLRLTVKKANGEAPDAEETADASRAVVNALELRDDDLRVLARHGVEVTSPGASDLITTQAAFEAFKGFDVTVRTLNPIEGGEERVIEGRLQERTTTDVVINVKGRMVKIPWHLVGEVRLPPAKSE
jgi:ribosome maturation factor RimP